MDTREALADAFETNRAHLQAVAYRMLGSLPGAEDAVQETWLRLSRSDSAAVENLGGWLTTVVARVSLDMLRSRKSRQEESLDSGGPASHTSPRAGGRDPEQELMLANSVGLALLVILDTLDPAERLAFVLHDVFAIAFDEIAEIIGKSPDATRQLASRARRRIQGTSIVPDADRARQKQVVDAFLAAAQGGDFEALMAVLDPDIVFHADRSGRAPGVEGDIRGAAAIAQRVIKSGARAAQPILVNGSVGVIVAPAGRLLMVLAFTIASGRVVAIDAISDPARLERLDLAVVTS
jgi:RNA polymerase sigma-70 factor (ECF subfamily)